MSSHREHHRQEPPTPSAGSSEELATNPRHNTRLEELQVIRLQSDHTVPQSGTLTALLAFYPFPSGLTVARRPIGGVRTPRASLWVSDRPHLNQTPMDIEKQRLDFSRIRTPSELKGTVHLAEIECLVIVYSPSCHSKHLLSSMGDK